MPGNQRQFARVWLSAIKPFPRFETARLQMLGQPGNVRRCLVDAVERKKERVDDSVARHVDAPGGHAFSE